MELRIKKQSKNWAYLQIIFVLFCGFLTSELRFPSMITYFTDVLLVIMFIKSINKIRFDEIQIKTKLPMFLLVLLGVSSIVGAIYNLNSMSLLHYIWGFRNMGRTFIFIYCCVKLFDKNDIYTIIKLFDKLFWINIVYCSYQFWIQGLWCDRVGGVFGTNYGCLAYINFQLCIVFIYHVSMYINKQQSLMKTGTVAIACFYLATITELKVFFVEFIILLIVLVLSNKPTIKSVGILICGFLALYFGLQLVSVVLPDTAKMLSIEGVMENLTSEKGYTNTGDLSRFGAIPTLNKMFFSNNKINEYFGLGLGNCENSNFGIFNTAFYERYEYLNYRWFTHAMIYLELGATGLILFYAFLASSIFYAFKFRNKIEDKVLWSCSLGFPVVVIVCSMYNSSFRTEAGYISAFMLACIFILLKNIQEEKQENSEV